MDTFDLRWPKTDAIFYTDGERCRIVWRQKSGPGGSIENIALCKRRVADSLTCAPELLESLKGKGYTGLATEIANLVRSPQQSVPAEKVRAKPSAGVGKTDRKIAPVQAWLNTLEGSAEWQECGTRRAKTWQRLDTIETHDCDTEIYLKAPARTGASDWVVKLKPVARGRANYVCADTLKGLFSYLLQARSDAGREQHTRSDEEALEHWLCAGQALEHEALGAALKTWKKVIATH